MSYPVSVCILAQNHEAFIGDLILSLYNQSVKNFEVLFLDNHSSDKTFERTIELCQFYQLPLTFAHANSISKNIPSNCNSLINNAKGKFILLISGDDWLTGDSIEKKLAFLEKHLECNSVCSSVILHYHDTKEEEVRRVFGEENGNQFEALMLSELHLSSPGAMYRRSALEEVNGFDETIEIEDLDMWLKLSKKGKIGLIKEPLAYYRRHTNNISSTNFQQNIWLFSNALKTMKKYKKDPVYSKAISKFYHRFFISSSDLFAPKTIKDKLVFLKVLLKLGPLGRKAIMGFIAKKLKLIP